MKTVGWVALSVVFAVLVTVWLCHRHLAHRVKRVWVSYSEKYEDRTIGRKQDFEKVEEDRALFAEEKLSDLVSQNKGCMVVTRDEKHADYRVNIAVSRFLGDPSTYGEASLTITKADGDIVLAEHFYQDKESKEDIASQPITRAWAVLCSAQS